MHNLAARPRRLEHINFVGKLQVVSANCGPVAGHQSCIRVRKSRREGSRIHARCDNGWVEDGGLLLVATSKMLVCFAVPASGF